MDATTAGVQGPQIVVGLGNPGPAYQGTRHNLGQLVLDRLAVRLGCRYRVRGPALVAEAEWRGAGLFLAKPQAFMNVVGPSMARLLRDLRLTAAELVVVYDDLDLPFGQVRVRLRGRHGGHNGVRSLIESLGTTELRRIKVGIGRPTGREDNADWVLTAFTAEERAALPPILEQASDRVLDLLGRRRD